MIPVHHIKPMLTTRTSSPGSEIITVQHDFQGVFQIRVHEHLIHQRSKTLASLIDDARKLDESNIIIEVEMPEPAIRRWCVWLYGQALRKHREDPNNALLELGTIYRFSAKAGDHECANDCQDAIRDILFDQHKKVTIGLRPLLEEFPVNSGRYFDMLLDILVYGPYAKSGVTRDWLRMLSPKEEFLSVFIHLSVEFAAKAANEAAGDRSEYPDIMAPRKYHFVIGDNDTASESESDVGEIVSSSQILLDSDG
jgi:hypothetical protein